MLPILELHLIFSILFSDFVYQKDKSLNNAIIALLISLALPGLGMVLYVAIRVGFVCSKTKQHDPINKENSGRKYLKDLKIAEETNVVSFEESLLISDANHRRETMMKALKKDALNCFQFINTALNNDDAETSHYAAASMLHTRRLLDIKMREISKIHHEKPDDSAIAMDYFDITDRYIKIFDLDASIVEKYIEENILILKKIIKNNGELPQKYMMRLIELLIETKDYMGTKWYCDFFSLSYPDTEEKCVGLLKSYYEMKDKKNFDLIMRRFIDSDVIFSNGVLEIIRFWITAQDER